MASPEDGSIPDVCMAVEFYEIIPLLVLSRVLPN